MAQLYGGMVCIWTGVLFPLTVEEVKANFVNNGLFLCPTLQNSITVYDILGLSRTECWGRIYFDGLNSNEKIYGT